MTDDIPGLINRLTAATNSHDRLHMLKLEREIWDIVHPDYDTHQVPPYTSSVDAAITLVPDDWPYEVRRNPSSIDHYRFTANVNGHIAFAGTAALALCIAALKARTE
jgi:hypothetical protein